MNETKITFAEPGLSFVTVTSAVTVTHRHSPNAAKPLYAALTVRVEPSESPHCVMAWAVSPMQIPDAFAGAVVEGFAAIGDVVSAGGRDGAPIGLRGFRITVVDGSFHPLDSTPEAFRTAARDALSLALQKAGTAPWSAGT